MLNSHQKTIFEIIGRHPIHPFPARMAPGIALEALADSESTLRVLDPMVGSGTVLAVARRKGHHAFGVDIDPLAVLLAKVWTKTVPADRVMSSASSVLKKARAAAMNLNLANAYPKSSDEATQKFIRYWFDGKARKQLTSLAAAIHRIRDDDVRDVLWAGLSRLIITKQAGASRAMDLSHSRPHRKFTHAPVLPFDKFEHAVRFISNNCVQPEANKADAMSSVTLGDARSLAVESNSIDLVLTSPPYLNAIDYLRCSKFSLVWMGYNVGALRKLRSESVGTEASTKPARNDEWVQALISSLELNPALSSRDQGLLAQFAFDMSRALAETARVLRPGARAVYVVGDSASRGTFIPNSRIVTSVAQRYGLTVLSRQSRPLPANRRYLPPPKTLKNPNDTLDGRLRQEVVIVFEKPLTNASI